MAGPQTRRMDLSPRRPDGLCIGSSAARSVHLESDIGGRRSATLQTSVAAKLHLQKCDSRRPVIVPFWKCVRNQLRCRIYQFFCQTDELDASISVNVN